MIRTAFIFYCSVGKIRSEHKCSTWFGLISSLELELQLLLKQEESKNYFQ